MRNITKLITLVATMAVTMGGGAKTVIPDSLLTIKKAYSYTITSIETSMAIVQAMRQRQMEPQWQLDIVEGSLNYNIRRFRKALAIYERAYEAPEIADSTYIQMKLLKRMMDCCDALLYDKELMDYTLRLKNKASNCEDKAYEAMTEFMIGKQMHLRRRTAEGYERCLNAVETMQQSDHYRKHIELEDFYAELLKMYTRDGNYDEALRMSKLQEAEAQRREPTMPIADERAMRRVYALRACLLAKAGRMDEADKAYDAWKETDGGNDIDDMEIFDYLRLSHRDEQALDVILRYRNFIHEQGDTISYRMLSVQNKEALVHIDMGEYEKAAMHGRQISVIADSIYLRATGRQMSTSYKLYQEQEASNRKTITTIILSMILALSAVAGAIVLYYTRLIRHRNKHMLKLLNSLDAYRKAVIQGAAKEGNTANDKDEATERNTVEHSIEAENAQPEEERSADDEENERLFIKLDSKITSERLFLKPDFGRDEMARVLGVDKNRIGRIMTKYSNASNASVYINTKRVEYGAQLLLEHPEYTIATITTECGMKNTVTFNRIFKEVYSVTPSEYRAKMQEIINEQPSR